MPEMPPTTFSPTLISRYSTSGGASGRFSNELPNTAP